MIDYLIGVDGGGTGTRVRLARFSTHGFSELAQGTSGPSGLGLGIARAWASVQDAVALAFIAAAIEQPPLDRIAIGLGLAGVHDRQWAREFEQADPGYAALRLDTDAFSTLLGAHGGQPGAIVAIGTGSVGEVLQPGGTRREVGGWGFPAGDEASGAWIGLAAINHIEQVLDGRRSGSAFADAVIHACGAVEHALDGLQEGVEPRAPALEHPGEVEAERPGERSRKRDGEGDLRPTLPSHSGASGSELVGAHERHDHVDGHAQGGRGVDQGDHGVQPRRSAAT